MFDIWIANCCAVFLLGVLGTCVVIPRILIVSSRKHLWDVPDARKIHHFTVSRLGGVAFSPMMVFALAMLAAVNSMLGFEEMGAALSLEMRELCLALCAVIVLALTGLEDDLISMRYQSKFFFQILSAIFLVIGGLWVCNLHGIAGINGLPLRLGAPFTVLLVVYIINAMNLIDGLDGLASGLGSMACLSFGLTLFLLGEKIYAVLAFTVLGVLVTFYFFNVFGNAEHGKKIFMGDTGSMTLGFVLSLLAVKLTMCNSPEATPEIDPMVAAFSPLLVPCLDVFRVYLHRVRNGHNPFLPDNNHIHHRLLALGMTQRGVRLTLFGVSLAFIIMNITLSLRININWIILTDIAIYTLWNIILTRCISGRVSEDTAPENPDSVQE